MKDLQRRSTASTTDDRVERRDQLSTPEIDGQSLYHVPLTGADLQLIWACSTWICRLGPAPDIRARLVHLEQQLAGARPAR
jgi:hypothetical protein